MRAGLSKWLIAEELYIFSLVTHGSAAIVNVAINIALIPKFGGVGAAVATLVSYATAGFLSLLLHHRTRGLFFMMLKRSEEHTSELQSLMRISYAVFCLTKKKRSNMY